MASDNFTCDICGKSCRSAQGLQAHMRQKHTTVSPEARTGPENDFVKDSVAKSPEQMTLSELKEHVERTELLNRLKAIGGVEEKVRAPADISESIGLGGLAEPVRAELQSRAFLGGQNQGLNTKDVIELFQLLQSQNRQSQPIQEQKTITQQLAELEEAANLFGIDLKHAIKGSNNHGEGLDLGALIGIAGSISGADGDAISAVLNFKQKQEMLEFAKTAFPQAIQAFSGFIASRSGNGGTNGQYPTESELAICPRCDQVFTVPKGVSQTCPQCGTQLVTTGNFDKYQRDEVERGNGKNFIKGENFGEENDKTESGESYAGSFIG